MKTRIQEAEEKLKKYNQDSVIKLMNKLDNDKKEALAESVLDTDLESVQNVFKTINAKPEVKSDNILPMNATIKSMAKFYADYYPNFSFKTLNNLVEVFGLDPKKKIRGFSKGMQRQAEIILALASHPKYMLLDETFDGLDPQKKETTRKLFMEYMAESECSLIISSHNLSELADLCDHVGLINGKKLTMDCSVYDISQKYSKIRLIFDRDVTEDDFKDIQYKSLDIDGRVAMVIFESNAEEQKQKLNALLPMAIDEYKLTMEEVFLNEMEEKKYDITKIFEK